MASRTEACGGTASADYDIAHKLSPYLDLHLMIPILDWLSNQNMYDAKTVLGAQFDLAKRTNMADYAIDIYKKFHEVETEPEDMTKKRSDVAETYSSYMDSNSEPTLLKLLRDQQEITRLRNAGKFNFEGLKEEHQMEAHEVEILYDLAKFLMDCGQYSETCKNLMWYRELAPPESDRSFQALWGLFAAQILDTSTDPNQKMKTLHKLREAIDSRSEKDCSPLEKLQQRTWLIHWSLFVFLRREDAARQICEFFFTPQESSRGGNRNSSGSNEYMNVVQTNCPWILRYISAAAVIQNWKRNTQELVKVIKQEKESYSDPITRMLQCLYVDFDLEGAQEELSKCESLLKSDYFLAQNAFANEFVMCSRKMIFTKYCLIHQKIDMHKLAGQLRMSFEEFEKWMVDLIRSQRRSESNAQLDDAKIDTERGIAILEVRYPSIYERIIQKTEDLTYRSYELAGNLSKARLK